MQKQARKETNNVAKETGVLDSTMRLRGTCKEQGAYGFKSPRFITATCIRKTEKTCMHL
jgi:hypothetical protein